MSFYREAVIWKHSDRYYMGFFESWVTGDDPEWDVDFNFDAFEWASGPHATEQEAFASWNGSNPGGYQLHETENSATAHYNEMFAEYQKSRQQAIDSLSGRA